MAMEYPTLLDRLQKVQLEWLWKCCNCAQDKGWTNYDLKGCNHCKRRRQREQRERETRVPMPEGALFAVQRLIENTRVEAERINAEAEDAATILIQSATEEAERALKLPQHTLL